MWTQSVAPGQPFSEDRTTGFPLDNHSDGNWQPTSEQLPAGTTGPVTSFETPALADHVPGFNYYQDPMSLTQSGLAQHDHLYGATQQVPLTAQNASRLANSDCQYVAFSETQRSGPTSSGTPPLTVASSPTLDGGRSTVEPHGNRSYSLPSALGPGWVTDFSQSGGFDSTYGVASGSDQTTFAMPYASFSQNNNLQVPMTAQSCPVHTYQSSHSPVPTPSGDVSESKPEIVQSTSTPTHENKAKKVESKPGKVPATGTNDSGPGRKGKLYEAKPGADGFYRCPFRKSKGCPHEKTKLKCNYDKYVDSHLKPYRCTAPGCEEQRFSSTACRLRHEREAHGSHGHGLKPYLCMYPECERSKEGNGFPRSWNRNDHMKRVHDHPFDGKSPKGVPPELSAAQHVATQSRKRSAPGDDESQSAEKRQRVVASQTDLPTQQSQISAYPGQLFAGPTGYGMDDSEHYRQCQERLFYYTQNIKTPGDVEMMRQLGEQMVHYNTQPYPNMPRS